jgi:hypothetical protein
MVQAGIVYVCYYNWYIARNPWAGRQVVKSTVRSQDLLDFQHGSSINKPTEMEVAQNVQNAGSQTPDSSMKKLQYRMQVSNCSILVATDLRKGSAWSLSEE